MGGGDDTEAPRPGVTTAPDEVPGPRLTPYRFARNGPLERADGSLQNGSTGGTPLDHVSSRTCGFVMLVPFCEATVSCLGLSVYDGPKLTP